MARINLSIPSLGSKFVDLRETIPGDSFNWSWVRPLNQVKFLAVHHSAGPDTQTPEVIANFHINSNGWGGIGYHFLIAKDGIVFYVGDISTARANVAGLNEQVIGICLIGNFTAGRVPSNAQFDSTNKLCDFFISNYPDLPNVNSWDSVRGHKDLPGQSTACPGDNWPSWRPNIVAGDVVPTPVSPPSPPLDRGAQITEAYRSILGRDPDMGGLQTYINSPLSLDEIMRSMVNSQEHKELVRKAQEANSLKDQVDSLQSSLASLNQQVLTLRETVSEKDQEITDLRIRLQTAQPLTTTAPATAPPSNGSPLPDKSLTIVGALINLYKFIFPPRKVE